MKRITLLIGFILIAASAFGLFHIKHKVQSLKKDLLEVNREIMEDKEAIHVLEAEWTYLTRPDRIEKLAELHLNNVQYTTALQMKDYEGLKNIYVARGVTDSPVVQPTLKPILSSW